MPVGTADKARDKVVKNLKARSESIEFPAVSNPEFLKEGSAVADCKKPDRVIVGNR